jgi:archaellum component FlaC
MDEQVTTAQLKETEKKLVNFITRQFSILKEKNEHIISLEYRALILEEEVENLKKIQTEQSALLIKLENQLKEIGIAIS